MNAILDKILAVVFERLPLLKNLDGYKRTIGNLLLVIAAILAAVQTYFPTYEPEHIAQILAYIGAALRIFGDMHSDAKTRLGK